MTRNIVNIFDELHQKETATASDHHTATASVDNSTEGVCPKCAAPMGTGIIPVATVYYCPRCHVATPVVEA